MAMNDFNLLTINAKCFPGTEPLVTQLGDKVRIRAGYMRMGETGMGEMAEMPMDGPKNSLATFFARGQYDPITMGGMFTLVKVRKTLNGDADPGWYAHPPETRARLATLEELKRDGIG
jgi:hypothetical protein